MSLYQRREKGFYWSRIVRGGEVFSRSTKCKNLTDARRVESQWIALAEHGNLALRRAERLILASFETRFFEYLDQNVTSPRTIGYYKGHWTALRESRLGGMDISRIGAKDVHDWSVERGKKVGPSGVNGGLRTLRRALRLAHDWNVIKAVPKIKLVKGENQREFVIDEKLLGKMLKHKDCTDVLKDLVPFLIDTGLRLGEAMSLQWKNVNLKDEIGSVFVERGKTKNARRTVPLTARAKGILERRKPEDSDDSGRVFDWSAFTVSHHFNTLRDALELGPGCVLHSCRHSFCSRLGNKGVSAFQIMSLAGHASVSISQRYVHENRDASRAAIALLN